MRFKGPSRRVLIHLVHICTRLRETHVPCWMAALYKILSSTNVPNLPTVTLTITAKNPAVHSPSPKHSLGAKPHTTTLWALRQPSKAVSSACHQVATTAAQWISGWTHNTSPKRLAPHTFASKTIYLQQSEHPSFQDCTVLIIVGSLGLGRLFLAPRCWWMEKRKQLEKTPWISHVRGSWQ